MAVTLNSVIEIHDNQFFLYHVVDISDKNVNGITYTELKVCACATRFKNNRATNQWFYFSEEDEKQRKTYNWVGQAKTFTGEIGSDQFVNGFKVKKLDLIQQIMRKIGYEILDEKTNN